jgi:hypothetical protein
MQANSGMMLGHLEDTYEMENRLCLFLLYLTEDWLIFLLDNTG